MFVAITGMFLGTTVMFVVTTVLFLGATLVFITGGTAPVEERFFRNNFFPWNNLWGKLRNRA